jgi:ABC-type hemin transport system ATPase subunit
VCRPVCRGGVAGRDVHLENFSVSNGGKDLIADANVIMAYGRRYGLIGRNGTGAPLAQGARSGGLVAGAGGWFVSCQQRWQGLDSRRCFGGGCHA